MENNEIMEIEAQTLEEALKSIPKNKRILTQDIQCDGSIRESNCFGETVVAAKESALFKVPEGAYIIEEETTPIIMKDIDIIESTEELAIISLKKQLKPHEEMTSIQLKKQGKKGFLGLGKTPNVYTCAVRSLACASVKYKLNAKIKVELQTKSEDINELIDSVNRLKETIKNKAKSILENPELKKMNAITTLMVAKGLYQWLEKSIMPCFDFIIEDAGEIYPNDIDIKCFIRPSITMKYPFNPEDLPIFWKDLKVVSDSLDSFYIIICNIEKNNCKKR